MAIEAYKERPILFSAPMVRALLEGRKTQTRRVVKLPMNYHAEDVSQIVKLQGDDATWFARLAAYPSVGARVDCPYGKMGDRLWVRENTVVHASIREQLIGYMADGCHVTEAWEKGMPSIHMRRAHSRITLEITEVRVQRLQEISGEDCVAGGVTRETLSALLQSIAARAKTEHLCWIRMESGDSDEKYCRSCADLKLAELIAAGADPNETLVDGGWGGNEEDSQPFCETCGVLLKATLTDYAVGGELDHYREYSAGQSPESAWRLLQMVDGCVNESDQGALAKIGHRWIWESIYGVDSWAANPWIWAVSFKVVR